MHEKIKNAISEYEINGYAKLKIYQKSEFDFIRKFAENWVMDVIYKGSPNNTQVKKWHSKITINGGN
jgi:hypothetical protein